MALRVVLRKWGNSGGIFVPKEYMKERNIDIDDVLAVNFSKKADFKDVFGSVERKLSGQEFKDAARRGWKK